MERLEGVLLSMITKFSDMTYPTEAKPTQFACQTTLRFLIPIVLIS